MKFLHTSDLHLGIKLLDVDLLDDQKFILDQILKIAKERTVDALLIPGDIYDVSIPRVEAVALLDEFLTKACAQNLKVFIISGNHDQAERLSFANALLKKSGVYISERYKKDSAPVVLQDEFGELNVYLLPFIKPINVKSEFQIEENISYDQAVKIAVENFSIDKSARNVLLAHQFITGGISCDSESIQIGNVDNASAEHFAAFDYAALGHLHTPQILQDSPNIRYSGSPLKLSFSEAKKDKLCYLIDLKQKGNVDIKEIPLKPLHDMAVLKASYKELAENKEWKEKYGAAYLSAILTDQDEIPYAKEKLRAVYKNILEVIYEKNSKRMSELNSNASKIQKMSDLDLVQMFFKEQMQKELSQEQKKILAQALENQER